VFRLKLAGPLPLLTFTFDLGPPILFYINGKSYFCAATTLRAASETVFKNTAQYFTGFRRLDHFAGDSH